MAEYGDDITRRLPDDPAPTTRSYGAHRTAEPTFAEPTYGGATYDGTTGRFDPDRDTIDAGPVAAADDFVPAAVSAPPAVPVEPSKPRRTLEIGRRLRSVAGVDEDLLARVPQERARYTALGGVVVGTALIAAFSMWFAISEALGQSSPFIVIPALIWGVFIFNFDRWLVSSALGTAWHKRFGTLIMRVMMAVLFGIIIAEPLVLRVFQTAIVKNVQDVRSTELANLQSKLIACNPESLVPGGATPAGCQGYMLTFPSTPGSAAAELTSKRSDATALTAEIATDTKQLNTLNNEARLECVGASGSGLTGRAGVGPNCTRLRGEADAYAKAHPVGTETAALTALQKQISTLEGSVGVAQQQFEAQRTSMINARVVAAKSHQGSIGILERMAALARLAKTSSTLFFGTWAVRLFFILVDCMPILVKFLGGVTTYDRLVGRQLADADAEHAADLETARDERSARVRRRRAEIDVELREHRAVLGSRVSRAVHDLATEYVEPTTPLGAPPNTETTRRSARVG